MRRILVRAVLVSSFVLLLLGVAFGDQSSLPVGEHPRSIAVGDFNRDGWDDFAVANELSNDITICLANQDGTCFCSADRVKYDSYRPVIPTAIAVGDLTRDGEEDLALAACGLTEIVTTSTSGTTETTKVSYANVFTFKGDGKGGFKIDKKYQAGNCPSAIALADLDRDGKLEIVVANSSSDNITIIDGSKQEEFKVGTTPVALAVGDFNRDAKLDLAVANSGSNTVSILLGKGGGKFEDPIPISVGQRPQDVGVGDLNCDNRLDLVVANFDSDDVWTLFGDGAGGFTFHAKYRVDQAPSALVVRDFNQDAMLDVAVTNAYANDVWILSGRRASDGTKGELEAVTGKFAVEDKPVAIACGDFDKDRDGNPDLAVANELTNDVTILLGEGAGGFFLPEVAAPGNQPPVADFSYSPAQPLIGETVKFDGSSSHDPDGSIKKWDWDFGDGASGSGKTVEHAYNEEGQYKVCLTVKDNGGAEDQACDDLTVVSAPAAATKAPAVGEEPSGIASGDFDNDNKDDLAIVNQGGDNLTILLGAGEGKFSISGTITALESPSAIVAADFNKDSQLDLAVTNAGANSVSILTGDGKGGFHAREEPDVGSNPMFLAAGDIDNDGNLDLAVANSGSNNVSVLLGKGDGTFKEAINTETTGDSPEGLALEDLNSDGNLDLVVSNLNSGDLAVSIGNGDGTFAAGTKLSGLNHPRRVVIEDFNGDGKLDIAVADSDSNAAVVFLGKGDGSFEEQRISAKVGESPRALVAGDLNNDNKPDLAVANYSSNSVSALLGKGDGSFEEQRIFNVGEKPNDIAAGKFNADGNPDMATANSGSNDVSVLLGRGDGTFEDPAIGFLESAWSGALFGGLGSLLLFPLILWLWGIWADGERRSRLLARIGLRR